MANPMPMLPLSPLPPRDAIAELMPMTAPDASTSAPPELPGLIGRVGLDRVDDRVRVAAFAGRVYRPVERRDDAGGDGAPQPERRADRDHRIADGELGRVAQAGDGEIASGDLEHGEVGERVAPDDLRRLAGPVAEGHQDRAGRRRH